MLRKLLLLALVGIIAASITPFTPAADRALKISIPKRGKLTPVQQLNRDGVEAVNKNQFEKAESLFYKAYLFDPDDPFTLNNLGYISELKGEVERARRFYDLASRQETAATIDRSTSKAAEGKEFKEAVNDIGDRPLQVNRANVEAIRLMNEGRPSEAEALLKRALDLDPRNPYTLNNMGVVQEMKGDFDQALKYYRAVADSHSTEPVIVTPNRKWRGKPISEAAADSEKKVRQRLQTDEGNEARVARLNLQGVAAINRNNRQEARQYFQQAYALDQNNAFSLNNLGYVAELEGDSETAQVYYEKARSAERANVRVGSASSQSAEGMRLFEVADDSSRKVDTKIAQVSEARRRETGPIQLKRRDGKPVDEGNPQPDSSQPQDSAPQQSPGLGPPQPSVPQLAPQPQPSPTQAPPDESRPQ
jgi:Flp pilus assembly protein TadD